MNSVDDILSNLDQNQVVAGIFLDLSKAFDSLHHEILFEKMHCIGIRGVILDWFKSYLNQRVQFTCVNNVSSSYETANYGVPQGSVLGPLLFLIYVNDIGKIPGLRTLPKLFADDSNIFVAGKNYDDLRSESQISLNLLSQWFLQNRLTINISKTCYTIFKRNEKEIVPNDFKLLINNIPLKRVEQCKYLGITIDSKLNWADHIEIYVKAYDNL